MGSNNCIRVLFNFILLYFDVTDLNDDATELD